MLYKSSLFLLQLKLNFISKSREVINEDAPEGESARCDGRRGPSQVTPYDRGLCSSNLVNTWGAATGSHSPHKLGIGHPERCRASRVGRPKMPPQRHSPSGEGDQAVVLNQQRPSLEAERGLVGPTGDSLLILIC